MRIQCSLPNSMCVCLLGDKYILKILLVTILQNGLLNFDLGHEIGMTFGTQKNMKTVDRQ